MGFRVQRSIGLGRFLRLNISKSGIGLSAGIGGLRVSTGPRGSFLNLNLPGTGFSYRKKISRKTLKDVMSGASEEVEAQATEAQANIPDPGFFAPRHEKELTAGLESFYQGDVDEALTHLLEAAPEEPGAAILAAAILAERNLKDYQPIALLEPVVWSEDEFPTELMEKYLSEATVNIAITPHVNVNALVNGLAAILLLIELYQAQRRVREAITLLEELVKMSENPLLTLSLCDLYASRGMWDEIIEVAKNTESLDDVTLKILVFYGRAMQEKGLHQAAISVLSKAVRRKKDRTPVLLQEAAYWRAISYKARGKIRRANEEFQKLYAENPDFKDVSQCLAELAIK